MKPKQFIRFTTAISCIAALLVNQAIAQELTGTEGKYLASTEKEFNMQSGGSLIMEEINGDVTVTTWDKSSAKISETMKMEVFTRGEAEAILKKSQSSYTKSGNSVTVRGLNGKSWVKQKFTVVLPEKCSVDINTKNGDISITGLQGKVSLKTSNGDIHLSNITGDVKVHTSKGDLEFAMIKGSLNARTSGGDIELEDIQGKTNVSTSGGDISLNKATDHVQASTSGGDIEIYDVSGHLKASTSGGDITISDCKGNAKVSTSGGDITLENILEEVKASTSGGDIEGDGLHAVVQVSTSGGDIELTDVHGPIKASTSGGDVDVEIALKDFRKPHDVTLHTSGGEITLSLPAKIPASILAEIQVGRNMFDRNDIYSDFPLSKTKVTENGKNIIRSTGDINGGGDMMELKSSGGDIYIKKQ